MSKASFELQYTQDKTGDDTKQPFLKCRHIVALIGFSIFLLLSLHRSVMSVAIVAMVNNTAISHMSETKSESCSNLISNVTADDGNKKKGEFIWSPQIQGYVLGSYFLGYVLTQFPSGLLAERYGCKWFLFFVSLITGIFTLLIPPISFWISAVIVVQAIRGLAQGFVQTTLSVLVSNWFPKTERACLYISMGSATSLGTALGYIFTGYICDVPGKWPFSFYTVGIAGLLLSLSILFLLAENPKVHPSITKAELNFILSDQEGNLSQKRPKRPWLSMLTSVPVYAYAIGYFGEVWALSHFWTVQSIFLDSILHYPIAENGVLAAIPFLLQFIGQLGATVISFYLKKNNITNIEFLRKFWSSISGLGFSGCLLGMYAAGCRRTLSIVFSFVSLFFLGMGAAGIFPCATEMTPTFAGSLNALVCTAGYTASFILPVIVGYITDKTQTIEQWNKIFFISIGVVMITRIVFICFGTTEVQPWNFVDENTRDNTKKRTVNNKKHKNEEMTHL